jgi:hypothetical protein
MTSKTFIIRSSYADITIDRETGRVLERDYAAMGGKDEWDDVERFDPATLPADEDETDCLLVGFWNGKGTYVGPLVWSEKHQAIVDPSVVD